MSDTSTRRRLSDLLRQPREDMGVEAKAWLDLTGNPEHKAVLAKALLALANHGGGFVLLGFDDTPTGLAPSLPRPPTLDGFGQDIVNGIVQAFADPPFHCTVSFVPSPTGDIHPIISVPGGHRVPIRAKKGGPNNATVVMHSVYIRRPGPKSEVPQTAQEWDDLFARCLAAQRDQLLDSIRNILSGFATVEPPPGAGATLDAWTSESRSRWEALVGGLAPDDGRRCPLGRYWFSYELDGDVRPVSVPHLREVMERSTVRHSGWSPWWVPNRGAIVPYYKDDALECWLGHDGTRDAAHSDFWRVSPKGRGFLMRGYQEDGPDAAKRVGSPGTVFDLILPIWRVGEALLNIQSLATNLGAADSTLLFRAQYEGLARRELKSVSGDLWDDGGGTAKDDVATLETVVPVGSISANLPEIVHPLLEPLYARFGLYRLSMELVRSELAKMRSNRY